MPISKNITAAIQNSSVIRKMFEEGIRRVKLYGEENVFDLSIGNPVFEPPPEVKQALLTIAQSDEKGTHRYMPNPGYTTSRDFICRLYQKETGLSLATEDVVFTTGAAGALNVIFKTLLDPGNEVIVLMPYFSEYDFYFSNHGGTAKRVDTNVHFHFDFDNLEKALAPGVKAVLINTPNNPTGVVYNKEELDQLGKLLSRKSKEFGYPITLVSDEPYKNLSYGVDTPSIFNSYDNSIIITSYSKDLAIPGERIGYIAISPNHEDRTQIQNGAVVSLRILGFINAPAIWQRVIPLVGNAKVDLKPYRENRDLLYDHLTKCGFECTKAEGGFYLFPKSPIEDDREFIKSAQELNLLMVPGSAFRRPGYFRLAFCFETDFIHRSLPLFTKLAEQYGIA
ncbi:pyridoxal phosphate-dependent aminotransferase [bacterium]|nr:pyridoxal phosphate-dependent aminotransferase [bacterium]